MTDANVNYVGSITIDEELIESAGFWPGEKVLIADVTNGARLETYIMTGERGSGVICINGAAARLVKKRDKIIIMGFELADRPLKPNILNVDEFNKIKN